MIQKIEKHVLWTNFGSQTVLNHSKCWKFKGVGTAMLPPKNEAEWQIPD